MVKKTTIINKISNFFIESLNDEDADFELHIENLADLLINSGFCLCLTIKTHDNKILVSRGDSLVVTRLNDLTSFELGNWGSITIDA
jgi:hypothetical protein